MAIELPFTDKTGTTHPELYAKAVQININTLEPTGHIEVLGFHDETAREEKRPPVVSRPITVTPEIYAQIEPEVKALAAKLYTVLVAMDQAKAPVDTINLATGEQV